MSKLIIPMRRISKGHQTKVIEKENQLEKNNSENELKRGHILI